MITNVQLYVPGRGGYPTSRGKAARLAISGALIALLACAAQPARADDGPAYRLNLTIDVPVIAIEALSVTPWFLDDLQPAPCAVAVSCDATKLNALDRPFAGRYRPAWTNAGTAVAALAIAAPAPLLLAFERPRHAVTDAVVLAESVLTASALGVIFEVGTRRPRPFVYGTAASYADRTDINGSLSFFSGHTADAFAATVAFAETLRRLHHCRASRFALGVGLAAASFVGVSRVVAGDHFPTDVIAGAGVGAGIGVLVPALHDRGVAVTPMRSAAGWGIAIAARY